MKIAKHLLLITALLISGTAQAQRMYDDSGRQKGRIDEYRVAMSTQIHHFKILANP